MNERSEKRGKVDLSVDVGGVRFDSPFVAASGTFGYGAESLGLVDLSGMGGVVTKGVSPRPKVGNPPPRIWETRAGMLNSIGLENPGIDKFLSDIEPTLRGLPTRVIANYFGRDEDEYVECARRLAPLESLDALEMNLSCPNVRAGGLQFGTRAETAARLVKRCKDVCSKPIWVKLSLAGHEIVDVARACVEQGADGLTLGNTLPGMAIDPVTRNPRLGGLCGGLSGPAIHPVAVRVVFEVSRAGLGVPIIGVGGVRSAEDAIELILAGASLIQVGTQCLVEPGACVRLADDLASFLSEQSVERAADLIGAVNA
jgi:dihydroorotate dehydrogenase (NAD+) catalytic subunit